MNRNLWNCTTKWHTFKERLFSSDWILILCLIFIINTQSCIKHDWCVHTCHNYLSSISAVVLHVSSYVQQSIGLVYQYKIYLDLLCSLTFNTTVIFFNKDARKLKALTITGMIASILLVVVISPTLAGFLIYVKIKSMHVN